MEGQPNSPCTVAIWPLQHDNTTWHVEIKPSTSHRAPTTFVCIIDVSGSMVNTVDAQGSLEETGLTRLDIVKHSLRTLIAVVNEHDKICLITFSTGVKQCYANNMTVFNKVELLQVIDSLAPDGYTNLWGGLQQGLQYCQTLDRSEHVTIMLLTDGEPTEHYDPPNGWKTTLNKELLALQQVNGVSPSINVFGYGYQLRSDLLMMMAKASGGIYSFIPDASMVGTVLIDFICNELSTALPNTQLNLSLVESDYCFVENEASEGQSIVPVVDQGSRLQLNLGTVHSGQNRHGRFMIKRKDGEISSDNDPVIHYELIRSSFPDNIIDSGLVNNSKAPLDEEVIAMQRQQTQRYAFIELVKALHAKAMFDLEEARKLIPQFLETLPKSKTPFEQALYDELDISNPDKGQVAKACQKREWYDRWGLHHLLSLQRALELEQRHNFKDPSVSHFGGPLFRQLNDDAAALFKSLPPPKPSGRSRSGGRAHVPINMGNYYDVDGGCIDGDVVIKLINSGLKCVSELRRGDVLHNGLTVEFVLVQGTAAGCKFRVVEVADECFVTPWHPVQVYNSATLNHSDWVFPEELGYASRHKDVDSVYNVVLSCGDAQYLETSKNHRIITLAHGLEHSSVVKHSFFGGQLLREKCRAAAGQQQGHLLKVDQWIRNPETGLIDDVQFTAINQISQALCAVDLVEHAATQSQNKLDSLISV